MTISRRGFVGGVLGFAAAGGSQLVAVENSDAQERVPPWKKGEFQIHFIHTGVGESQFLIFPDGTTMLLDCPGNPAVYLGRVGVPILPSAKLHAGEWVAKYVQRVNPTVYPSERRIAAILQKAPWLPQVVLASFAGGHVVVTVPPGGKTFTVRYIDAGDVKTNIAYEKEMKS